ncbi:hypothetical protein QJS04_geneDACA023216 [Acorus gramineus]|uniref:DUF3700 domain-containing protein n=1 Tax=Acorus gramineus TaxID=55184 RepID=A0AAV9ANQ4_ACOGR|nr:hypothetical protein QJS04_geneDACA023216 [Acorus gramineus]
MSEKTRDNDYITWNFYPTKATHGGDVTYPRMTQKTNWCKGRCALGLDNIASLKDQVTELNNTANEVVIVIEAYPADQVVRGIHGKFVFILFDSSKNGAFIASDADGRVPFFWATNSKEASGTDSFCHKSIRLTTPDGIQP